MMPNTMYVYLLVWAILTVGVLALAIYRNVIARGECDVLHLRESELALVPKQATFSHRLELLNHWGIALTIISVCYGLALGSMLLYQAWKQAGL